MAAFSVAAVAVDGRVQVTVFSTTPTLTVRTVLGRCHTVLLLLLRLLDRRP